MQTLANVQTYIRSIVNKDTTTLSDATLLIYANTWYYKIIRELCSLNEDYYGEISTADLVANQAEYVLPTDSTSTPFAGGAIKVLRAEVSHNGTNWYTASPISLTNRANPVEGNTVAVINQDYVSTQPRYAFYDRSVFIYPIPTAAVTAGLRIFWVKRPNEMTSTASIPELPKDFLPLLAEGMLYDSFRKFNRIADADRALVNFNQGIQKMKEQEVQDHEPLIMRPQVNFRNFK